MTHDTLGGPNHTAFPYDYFLKDHLGNTRMVLTDEQQTDKYPAATMEIGDSATENLYYSKLDSTRAAVSSIAGYPSDTTTNPNNYVAKLDGDQHKIGPGITLKVMAGDQISIRVSSWYKLNGASPGTPVNPLPDLVGALISGIGNLPGGGHPTTAALQANSTPLSDNIGHFLGDTGSVIVQTKPHAFINWVLFDNQFNYVASSSGFEQVGNDQELKKHVIPNLPMTTSGYLYIYTSNETSNVSVFFDNLQVTHVRGPLLEENHYYPLGLTMKGVSDQALKTQYGPNKYRYNGKELQNQEFADGSGLEEYDYEARLQDPQLGRFTTIDPLSAINRKWSPYSYAADNPVRLLDPDGRNPVDGPTNLTSVDVDPKGKIIHINQDGDPGVYMIADPNGPRSLIGFMDPNKKYIIGGQYQYYGKKDYYEKYPLTYAFWVIQVPNPQDPNPDQNNSAELGREMAGATLLILLLDLDLPEGAGVGGAGELSSAKMGRIIGWGEGPTAEAAAQTKAVAEGLTSEQIQVWAKQGLTKEWVAKQLAKYTKAVATGGKKLENINLLPRKELMEKILSLWK